MPAMIPFIRSPNDLPDHSAILNGAPNVHDIFAVSTCISAEWVNVAYQSGLFPWYSSGEPVLWHSPNPRMVLQLKDFKYSISLKKRLKQWARQSNLGMRVTINRAFEAVITACAETARLGQEGTWITPELAQAYIDLHHQKQAVSIEVWQHDTLVAGLYGVLLGRMFFGESMFTHITDGSKVALACWVEYLQQAGFEMMDCQQQTEHLTRLGGAPISRALFFERSAQLMQAASPDWETMSAHTNLLSFYQH
ncbi:leucyl/phenylalanyl-tRNA--protein transferase [Hydromonas duriensis]|uniref:Leucyl/phenylalanyl-tRNA--protein transferase n=1 Tax=Hydromonas duriensis TaxID=1527608 RepID=A0A4R6YB81_9BURK|nr:leucyl/phenylalanyl-tRNA--protein transferase [Hydromonas duriensis]TDR32849.1 leucyl/phenylalanyl-tRNA--protein transferase [Hydromonas duriensis]